MSLELVACPDCGGVGYVTPYHLNVECESCLGEGCVPIEIVTGEEFDAAFDRAIEKYDDCGW